MNALVSFDLPSPFIDAILPPSEGDTQFSNDANLDLFSSIPIIPEDQSVQYSLLDSPDNSDIFASTNDFTSGDFFAYQGGLLAANSGDDDGEASWFQSWKLD